MIQARTHCRTCGSKNLKLILDLGKTALVNDFLNPEEVAGYKISLPLRVVLCPDCSLVQLADTVDPKILYSHYAYVTSTSKTMDTHLNNMMTHLLSTARLGAGSKVLEIASNTGVFLKKFKEQGCEVLGIEPAGNIADVALATAIPTRKEFFNAATARKLRAEWGAADLILGRHVFAHIDDLRDLVAGLEAVSHAETLIAFEVPYVVDFFEHTEYDTIYHEHLSYISAASIEALVKDSAFMLARVDHYPIHGGSILFHLRHRSSKAQPHASVAQALEKEKEMRLAEPSTWEAFAQRVNHIRTELPALLRKLKAQGKRIIGYGASAKGNTLLNTCGITTKELDYIIDNTPFKQNKIAPGSWVPVRPPEMLLKDQPDYALLLAWNFAPEIIKRETEFQKRGGRFIVPIPEPKIIEPGRLTKIMSAEISLVILNYQGEPWLGRCLESICAQTAFARLEVVVVDNVSTDRSREICESFRARLPQMQFIANRKNLWYCEGNNIGARAANSPLFFFLNNDVWLEPDCVERLLVAAANGTADIFAVRVLDYADGHYQGFGALGFDWLGCVVSVPDHSQPRRLFSAYGCAFVIRKKSFDRVGGFPAEVQAYTDEIDLAWRVWISGGSVISEPAAKVHHRGAAAANAAGGGRLVEFRTNESKRFLAVRNGTLFWLKNGQHVLRLMLLPHLLLYFCEAIVWLALTRRFGFVWRSYAGGMLAAFRMGATTRKWREHNSRMRQHGDFWMLRFWHLKLGRWSEVWSLAKLGWPKVD